METRKFGIGDQVRIRLDSYNSENPADVYTISRVLPVAANVWQYRVKRVGDGQERAVNETQLSKAALGTYSQGSAVDMQRDAQRVRNARAAERARVALTRPERNEH
jgi:hypothetical protein